MTLKARGELAERYGAWRIVYQCPRPSCRARHWTLVDAKPRGVVVLRLPCAQRTGKQFTAPEIEVAVSFGLAKARTVPLNVSRRGGSHRA